MKRKSPWLRRLVAETLANAAHEAVDSVTKKASAAEESFRSAASESSESSEAIQEKLETAKKDLGELSAKVERYARANPLAAELPLRDCSDFCVNVSSHSS